MRKTAVIGAGVVGSTVAATLSTRQHAVTVFDAGQPGTEVSEASFAWVNAHHGKRPASYRGLNYSGLETHHRWHRDGRAPWFFPTGSLTVAGDRGGLPELQNELQAVRDIGAAHRQLAGEELQDCFPNLGPGVDQACFHPYDGWVDPSYQVAHQLSSLVGAEVRTFSPIAQVCPRSDSPGVDVRTADGEEHEFDSVIVTAGNGSPPLLRDLNTKPLLTTGTETAAIGMTVETEPLDEPPTTVVRSPDVSIRPTAVGGAVVADHATAANLTHEDSDLWALPRTLLERAATIMPSLTRARIARVRVSERVMPIDGLPVIGTVAPNTFVVLTHSGVTLAPLLSEHVADSLDGKTRPDPHYSPDRF